MKKKLPKGFIPFFSAKTLIDIASGFFGIFFPIFLYTVFEKNMLFVCLYFIIGWGGYALITPITTRYISESIGFRISLILSIIVGSYYYVILFFTDKDNAYVLIPALCVSVILFRILYWVPYHLDFVRLVEGKKRGRVLGIVYAVISIIGVLAPLLAGLIIDKWSYNILFAIGIILYVLAVFPYSLVPASKEIFIWPYSETLKQLFSRKNRKMVFAYMADGAENVISVVVWPIFIFEILEGNFAKVGLLSSLITAIVIIFQLLIGKYCDKRKELKKRFIRYGTYLYSIGWLLKLFVSSAFQIFFIDSYHKLTQVFYRIPFDVLTYEIFADKGHLKDEYTVLREMALNCGRVLMLFVVLIIVSFTNLSWTFLIAAFIVILIGMIKKPVEEIIK